MAEMHKNNESQRDLTYPCSGFDGRLPTCRTWLEHFILSIKPVSCTVKEDRKCQRNGKMQCSIKDWKILKNCIQRNEIRQKSIE